MAGMATAVEVPEKYRDLLERPLIASLATVREDGTPQVNPMWFAWDGEFVYFTHTSYRKKFRNLAANPAVSISIFDPDQPYQYVEVRGVVERTEPDPSGAFYQELARRYSAPWGDNPPPDAPDRVKIAVRITSVPGNQAAARKS
jgi:PPOX class probable F420-dependent enzyme